MVEIIGCLTMKASGCISLSPFNGGEGWSVVSPPYNGSGWSLNQTCLFTNLKLD